MVRPGGIRVLRRMAVQRYIEDVRMGKYPGEEYSYPLKAEELEELKSSRYWKDIPKEPSMITNDPTQLGSGIVVGLSAECNGRGREVNRVDVEPPAHLPV